MPLQIDVSVEAGNWAGEDALLVLTRATVDAAVSRLDLAGDRYELSVLFTDDATMRALNEQWRGKDTSTNVLSFPAAALKPGDAPGQVLGDIVLARQTIESEAELEAKSVDDHLRHLIVHGFLHLLGYDHENDMDAEEMETAERAILADIGIADPYSSED